ncbi:MAG: endonuclease/exonuclease/phosphatase family protein [Dehalococcoidia bacterium]
MRLITWNVNGRTKRLEDQLRAIRFRRADLVALQEITPTTLARWGEGLADIGLPHVIDSFALRTDRYRQKGKHRRLGQIIAARWPIRPLDPTDIEIPWTEKVLSGITRSPWGPIEIHNAHIPPGASHGWIKVETFEGICARLGRRSRRHRILCGDFNSPQNELSDGRTVMWGERRNARGVIVPASWDPDGEWAAGERGVICGLGRFDLRDVYRSLYGYRKQGYSWRLIRTKGS